MKSFVAILSHWVPCVVWVLVRGTGAVVIRILDLSGGDM